MFLFVKKCFERVQKIMQTDQPGRLVAVCIVSPILLFKGFIYSDTFITIFAIVLFVWDSWWLRYKPTS